MDHGSMTSGGGGMMDMPMSTGTLTATAAAATSTKASMSMGMGNGCKISMLWNWNTIDACFISSQWRIRSSGMFAGSCIGVILLVMSLELLRRAAKEYDRYLIHSHSQVTSSSSTTTSAPQLSSPSGSASEDVKSKSVSGDVTPSLESSINRRGTGIGNGKVRPTIAQQAIRATLHMVQFAVAYFVMLLAMYYNGYLIICIVIGAWLGAFVFSWGNLDIAGPKEDSTYCCG